GREVHARDGSRDAAQVDLRWTPRMREHSPNGGRHHELAARRSVVERSLAPEVTHAHRLTLAAIPDNERKVTIQPVGALFTPGTPCSQNQVCSRVLPSANAIPRKCLDEFPSIVH